MGLSTSQESSEVELTSVSAPTPSRQRPAMAPNTTYKNGDDTFPLVVQLFASTLRPVPDPQSLAHAHPAPGSSTSSLLEVLHNKKRCVEEPAITISVPCREEENASRFALTGRRS